MTTTTHKTLRGPRAGLILCKEKYAKDVDREVFPGIQGGPLMHIIAAKAIAFKEALTDEFKQYQQQVVKNAKALAEALKENGFKLVSNGTDNHLMLIDLRTKFPELTGRLVEDTLVLADITVNKNMVPFDDRSPFQTSGLRIGTPAVTTRGLKEEHMEPIVDFIDKVISNIENEKIIEDVKNDINSMMESFPLFAD